MAVGSLGSSPHGLLTTWHLAYLKRSDSRDSEELLKMEAEVFLKPNPGNDLQLLLP